MSEETTTEGITREEVEMAMTHLGVFNPKPEIPLEVTLTGHELVAVSRCIRDLERTLSDVLSALRKLDVRV